MGGRHPTLAVANRGTRAVLVSRRPIGPLSFDTRGAGSRSGDPSLERSLTWDYPPTLFSLVHPTGETPDPREFAMIPSGGEALLEAPAAGIPFRKGRHTTGGYDDLSLPEGASIELRLWYSFLPTLSAEEAQALRERWDEHGVLIEDRAYPTDWRRLEVNIPPDVDGCWDLEAPH